MAIDVLPLFAEDMPVEQMQALVDALLAVERRYFSPLMADPHCRLCGHSLHGGKSPVMGTLDELTLHEADCPMHTVRRALEAVRQPKREIEPVSGADVTAPAPHQITLAADAQIVAPETLPDSTDELCDTLKLFCDQNGLPFLSADELQAELEAVDERNEAAIAWLKKFNAHWDEVKDREDAAWLAGQQAQPGGAA